MCVDFHNIGSSQDEDVEKRDVQMHVGKHKLCKLRVSVIESTNWTATATIITAALTKRM